jgi:hypothetical protein
MAFDEFMTDTVSLIKSNGKRHADIRASVQRGKIFIDDASLVIEQGDLIERVASNGLRETYEVVDPGFHEKFGGIDAHYQIEVRRAPARSEAPSARDNSAEPSSGLHPWGVIAALTFELDSDEVVEIISLAGLSVDWSLTAKQEYSHSTRKRAYRPRVDGAFSDLSGSEKLRVSWVVSSELIRRHPEREGDLRDRLTAIGWMLDGGVIRPASGDVAELFFPRGSEHDAYVKLREIAGSARSSITVVDPYVDSSVLTILGTCEGSLDIRILSHKLPSDFAHEVARFAKQHSPRSVEVRRTAEFHDRFVIIDNSRCFHVGASIKDAGLRAFMISQVQDPANVRSLLEQVGKGWDSATSV